MTHKVQRLTPTDKPYHPSYDTDVRRTWERFTNPFPPLYEHFTSEPLQ